MAFKPNCGVCKLIINDLEPVCCGFCEQFFHVNQDCCGFNSKPNIELFKSGKAMFFCSACRIELNGRSIRAYIQAIAPAPAAAPDVVNDLAVQLRQLNDIVSKIGGKVDTLMSNQQKSSTSSQFSTVLKDTDSQRSKRRRDDKEVPVRVATKGTKTVVFENLSIPSITPAASPDLFWLYLAGFNPRITDDDIRSVVSQCMELPDIKPDIVRLVPKGVDSSRYSFVSFKVGVDPALQQKALSDIWPDGINFREFDNRTKNSSLLPATDPVNGPSQAMETAS